jgi:hypothetical protein
MNSSFHAVVGALVINAARRTWSWLLWLGTAEFLFRWYANCGPLIVARSLTTTTVLFASALCFANMIDPARTWIWDWRQARLDMLSHANWYGAMFAGSYVALYTRFASQWQYLAGLYNQIKQAESTSQPENREAFAQWKAGFIEDARELHLANKPLFATTIRHWCSDPNVRAALENDGRIDVEALLSSLEETLAAAAKRARSHAPRIVARVAPPPPPAAPPDTAP